MAGKLACRSGYSHSRWPEKLLLSCLVVNIVLPMRRAIVRATERRRPILWGHLLHCLHLEWARVVKDHLVLNGSRRVHGQA